jgi:hypothetical protein
MGPRINRNTHCMVSVENDAEIAIANISDEDRQMAHNAKKDLTISRLYYIQCFLLGQAIMEVTGDCNSFKYRSHLSRI